MKLRDTSELNKAVEELKAQEAQELSQLNKNYKKLDLRSKKLDYKVSSLYQIIFVERAPRVGDHCLDRPMEN